VEAAVAEQAKGWERRRVAGAAVRVGVTLAPAIVSGLAALVLNAQMPAARTLTGIIPRSRLIVAGSMAVLFVIDKGVRRLLPLASLLQLTLVFPDRAPSRFRTALKAGSGRRLARAVESARRDGLSSDPALAAEQLVVLATAISDHDRRTRGHSERVRLYAQLLGEELKLTDDELAKLQWAALIHDVGKIHVPTRILNKAGKPSRHEWTLLEQHPMQGEELAAPV
jgi:HD-GYP domain-containing protein (c-di-GMP phosphodiesterase class II)